MFARREKYIERQDNIDTSTLTHLLSNLKKSL